MVITQFTKVAQNGPFSQIRSQISWYIGISVFASWQVVLGISILRNPSFSTEYSGIMSWDRQNMMASVVHFNSYHHARTSWLLALSNAREMVVCSRLTDLELNPHFFNSCFFTTSACFNGWWTLRCETRLLVLLPLTLTATLHTRSSPHHLSPSLLHQLWHQSRPTQVSLCSVSTQCCCCCCCPHSSSMSHMVGVVVYY